MAVIATLVSVGHNILRYLILQDGAAGATVTITTTGGATPDLRTDSLAGPIKAISKVVADGYKQLPAGAQTQVKARALLLSDVYNIGDPALVRTNPTARCDLTGRDGFSFTVDANVDGPGNPTLVVTTQAAAGQGYLDVKIPNAIGA
jgi:hypothetical protein